MAWNPGLTRLRDLLAELYPTVQLSREVLEQAGLPTGHIEFSTAATSNWHEILKEADRRRQVLAVVAIARQEFPEFADELLAAEQEYQHPAEPARSGTDVPSAVVAGAADVVPVTPNAEPSLGVLYELLLAAFSPKELVRLFRFSPNAALRPVVKQFGPSDGLSDLAETALTFCETRHLLTDLLEEIRRENPAQYARFEPRLWSG